MGGDGARVWMVQILNLVTETRPIPIPAAMVLKLKFKIDRKISDGRVGRCGNEQLEMASYKKYINSLNIYVVGDMTREGPK